MKLQTIKTGPTIYCRNINCFNFFVESLSKNGIKMSKRKCYKYLISVKFETSFEESKEYPRTRDTKRAEIIGKKILKAKLINYYC